MSQQADSIARLLLAIAFVLLPVAATAYFDLPPLPPPEEYGSFLINRVSTAKGVKPVFFSHWHHRTLYTCRVCHGELDFNMKVNTTEITEAANRRGRYCGACHNGRSAFRLEGNCQRCHTDDIGVANALFTLFGRYDFPVTGYGNRIDWVEAMKRQLVIPNTYLRTRPEEINYDKKLTLDAEWNNIPPAVFPHRPHTAWLDCNNCHPEIFTIKKKATKHFRMTNILRGEFCGVCHLTVAFPMNDCRRCHPGIQGQM